MATWIKEAISEEQRDEAQKQIRDTVEKLLEDIDKRGDSAVRELSKRFDNWSPDEFRLSEKEIQSCIDRLDAQTIGDICFAQEQIRNFAQIQRDSMKDVEEETLPGVILGHRNIPTNRVGSYVPGGKFPMVASAHMSVVTAKVAGVKEIITCAPPYEGRPSDAIVAAQHLGGADDIFVIGGVQAVAAMALGTESIPAVDMLVGPGNAYVAEAKRQLYGRVGIDLFAGPTEIAIIADKKADKEIVAADIVGQAEHGYNSPGWLITTDKSVADYVIKRIPELIKELPGGPRDSAEPAWRDFGEVVLCDTNEEMANVSDKYAPEHLEVHAENLDWWLKRLKNYGSLFLGEETTVAYGDKCSGPNHILPTKGAGRYTGGLYVGKFIKCLTFQRMSKDANKIVGATAARLARAEGMEAHARTGDIRLKKYGHSN